ncbi:helix-turn-helix transcriptional regulator [Aquipuribacter nitratireducens]|uniref:AAA family ATPase n=1 Tax=Aquipuribacter nitratireducens TaxID=650104 RepID=A0ABW0GMV2_9MICO
MRGSARLVGRDEELRRIQVMLTAARNGRGGALRVVGDAGIGKTALLDAAVAAAGDACVLRTAGYEAEASIPFAAVQRLVIPLHPYMTSLADRHATVLRIMAGDLEGPPPERFLVALALLDLLSSAADRAPVLCAVDDAHALDAESADVLGFVGRRLGADPVVVLIASREENGIAARLAGLPSLPLSGLDADSGRRLLGLALDEPLDPAVAVQVVRATGGVPLALVDLATELSNRQLEGRGLDDAPLPIGRHLEEHYLSRVRGEPRHVQDWLLVAAAESAGSPVLVAAAADALGIPPGAVDDAEAGGLVTVDDVVRFRHPLVRSAVYNGTTGDRRRSVHAALAGAAARLALVEVEAWHASHAVTGHDDAVADRLEHAADLAARRGGLSSRATVLARAAELTTDGAARDRRYVAAAEAALEVGAAGVSADLLARSGSGRSDPVTRGRAALVGAALSLFAADPEVVHAAARLGGAADLLHGADGGLEHTALLRAFEACLVTEHCAEGFSLDELGRRLEAAGDAPGPMAALLRGLGALVRRPYAEAVPVARAALDSLHHLPDERLVHLGSASVALATFLWDVEARTVLLTRAARTARDAGALQALDTLLWLMASTEPHGGTVRRAHERLDQLREVRRSMGYDTEQVVDGGILAWSGAREAALAVAAGAEAVGFGGVTTLALGATATLDIAQGRYRDAYERLAPLVAAPFLQATPTRYADFVEAASRSGHTADAEAVAEVLRGLADANGSAWCRGVALRSLALVTEGDAAESAFREAVSALRTTPAVMDLGRAHLVYGEWLRRARRRREARDELGAAVDLLRGAGADILLPRAQAELEALGGAPVTTSEDPLAGLSARELAVARLAGAGRTNAEIGDRLFISRNTVDYHLRKVFQRLGISSRRQLADLLADRRA